MLGIQITTVLFALLLAATAVMVTLFVQRKTMVLGLVTMGLFLLTGLTFNFSQFENPWNKAPTSQTIIVTESGESPVLAIPPATPTPTPSATMPSTAMVATHPALVPAPTPTTRPDVLPPLRSTILRFPRPATMPATLPATMSSALTEFLEEEAQVRKHEQELQIWERRIRKFEETHKELESFNKAVGNLRLPPIGITSMKPATTSAPSTKPATQPATRPTLILPRVTHIATASASASASK